MMILTSAFLILAYLVPTRSQYRGNVAHGPSSQEADAAAEFFKRRETDRQGLASHKASSMRDAWPHDTAYWRAKQEAKKALKKQSTNYMLLTFDFLVEIYCAPHCQTQKQEMCQRNVLREALRAVQSFIGMKPGGLKMTDFREIC